MSISATGGHYVPLLQQTPTALRSAPSEAAGKAASGYGAASLASIQAITAKVAQLLAEASAVTQHDQPTAAGAAGNRHDGPQLRQGNAARVQAAAMALQQAQATATRLTPEAMLGLVAASMSELLRADDQRSIREQFSTMQSRLAARAARGEAISLALIAAQAALDAAQGDVDATGAVLEKALAALAAAEGEVARLEAELATAPPEKQEALRAQLQAARAAQQSAQAQVDVARGNFQGAVTRAEAALDKLSALLGESAALRPPFERPEQASPERRSAEAFLVEMLALLQQLVGQVNAALQKANQAQVEAMLEAKSAENMRRAKEYEEQLAKAEATQKKMGCIGKIVGWVLTVAAVVAAPFTGGTSMVLAGIGLALAIGEELGLDVMGKLLQPVMNLVMKAVKAVAGVVGDIMKSMGIPPEIVNKLKDVVAVIAIAMMIIATVFISRKLAASATMKTIIKTVAKAVADKLSDFVSKAASKMLSQSARESISKMAGQASRAATKSLDMVKTAVKGANKRAQTFSDSANRKLSRLTDIDVGKLATRFGQLRKATDALQFANQTSQGVGNVVVADMYVKAEKIRAAFELGLIDSRILRELMERLLDYFINTNDLVLSMFDSLSEMQSDNDRAARSISQRITHA